jgi:hypothetical protein
MCLFFSDRDFVSVPENATLVNPVRHLSSQANLAGLQALDEKLAKTIPAINTSRVSLLTRLGHIQPESGRPGKTGRILRLLLRDSPGLAKPCTYRDCRKHMHPRFLSIFETLVHVHIKLDPTSGSFQLKSGGTNCPANVLGSLAAALSSR